MKKINSVVVNKLQRLDWKDANADVLRIGCHWDSCLFLLLGFLFLDLGEGIL